MSATRCRERRLGQAVDSIIGQATGQATCRSSGRWVVRSLAWLVLGITVSFGSADSVEAQAGPAGTTPEGSATLTGAAVDAVEGAWRAEEYVLASGPTHLLRGHIMFAGGDWNVLFFVLNTDGKPVRMSAEGGTYTLQGDDLVFTHLYFAAKGEAVEGLPEALFEMRALESGGAEEAATVSVEGDRMTLFFPSQNQMRFTRAPGG